MAMSEYQYYEFQAIDRPLTAKEMSELRSFSTRARITPVSFVNDYSWGSFKGNADAWMDSYFDAFLYLANWGTHVLKLRLPSHLLDTATAEAYCGGDSTSIREKAGKIILSFVSQDEEGGDWVEGEGHLSALISVRAELARGDLRALYLGWLLRAQTGELIDDDVEPPVPPGLGQLSASLESLAEFLRIDSDLLHVAAEASSPKGEAGIDRAVAQAWIGELPAKEKDDVLTNLIVDGDPALIAELLQRFLKQRPLGSKASAPRTVRHLLKTAEAHATEGRRIKAEKRARENARREREAVIAREKHLDSLVGREKNLWAEVDSLIATRQTKRYDEAVKILVDLRGLAARDTGGDFELRVETLRQAQAKKPSLIERLRKVGL
jgi:hypothetical protein